MSRSLGILGLVTAVADMGVVASAQAAPVPSRAPQSWELDFEFHDLQRLDVVLPGDRQPTTFWYLLYTVTNNSGQDVDFYPSFQLVTDSLQVVTAGDHISPTVYDFINARHKKAYPFFRDPIRVSGRLLQGPDNARTSAAVFRDFDHDADSLKVYVAGLSGEITRMTNPSFDRDEPESATNPRYFTLRKTLEIAYDLPGDVRSRSQAVPIRRGRDWVMR